MRADHDSTARAGMTLLEVMAALVITALLLSVLLGLLLAQVRLARTAAQRVLAADAVRTAAAVIDGEVQRAAPVDVRAFSADSLALRSFRGTAVACGHGAGHAIVRYRGDRLPDEHKDSVLVIRGDGSVAAVALLSVAASAACTARAVDEAVLQLRTIPYLRAAAVMIVFESGSYYLTSRALRYRLGAEGRQPLTAEAFRDAATAFVSTGDAGVRYRLTTDPAAPQLLSAWFAAAAPP